MPGSSERRTIRVLVGLVAALALFLLTIELLARWNIRSEQQARADLGDRLYTEVVGTTGDPIVFLAGLQGSTRYWGHSFDELARDHRVIYVDLLGFGRSPWPAIDYTIDDHIGFLRRTLLALGATRDVTIVAHSFGTIIAAHYAAQFPGDIHHLYLLGTPVYANEKEARQRIWEMSPLAALFSLQPFLARETCLLMGSLRPVFRWLLPRVLRNRPRAVAEDAVLHSWPSIRGAMNILLTKPVAIPLRVVGRKSLLVHGTRDTITPVGGIRHLSQLTAAAMILLDSDHHGYAQEARSIVIEAIRRKT